MNNDLDDDAWFREAEKRAGIGGPNHQQQAAEPGVDEAPSPNRKRHVDAGSMMSATCGFDLSILTPPSDKSFEEYFKKWFEEDHFPGLNALLKKELVHRASQKSFLSGLSSQVKKWVNAHSDPRLQANVWYEYFKQHSPPSFTTVGCFRVAMVNMGSKAEPCVVRFYGYPEEKGTGKGGRWVCEPTIPWVTSNQGDMSTILDELDSRGGMSALVTCATTSTLDTIEKATQ